MDPTALALLSIFGGAALTALAGIIGAGVQARREHHRWIREQRLVAYQRVHQLVERMRYGDWDVRTAEAMEQSLNERADKANLTAAEREPIIAQAMSMFGDRQTARARFDWSREIVADKIEVTSLLSLVGTRQVEQRLEAVFAALTDKNWDQHGAALAELERAMRKSLGVVD